jgi:DNA primase
VIFPIRNAQGRIIGFGGRVITAEGKPKYLNSPETEWFKKGRELFALHLAKKNIPSEKPVLVIVEGYLDCLRLHEAGIRNAVATLGTALTEEHVRLIRRYAEEAVLVFDGDKAGESASFRSLDIFLEEGFPVRAVSLEEGLDPDDYIVKKGAEAFRKKLSEARDFFEFKLEYLLGRHSKKDPHGLLKITSSLLEVIAKIPSRILADHYLKRLSQAVGVEEQSLRVELGKMREKVIKSRALQPEEAKRSERADTAQQPSREELLLLYLLAEGTGRGTKIPREAFSNPEVCRGYEILLEAQGAKGEAIRFEAFLKRLESSRLKERLAELSFMEWTQEGREKALRDCLARVERMNQDAERRQLEAKIRQAESEGDLAGLRRNLMDFQQLTVKANR